jgi:archaellum component FlaC
METKKEMPHLGSFVQRLTYKMGLTATSLAIEIDKKQNTVIGYSKQTSLHAKTLWDISKALNYDIFEYLSIELNLNGDSTKTKSKIIEELELQVKDLKKEVAIYKDLLKR